MSSIKTDGRRGNDRNMDSVTGLRGIGVRDLSYKLCFLVNCVRRTNWQPLDEEIEDTLTHAD